MRRVYCLYAVLVFACFGSPVWAGRSVRVADICYQCGDETIFGLTNLIAYLEANPDVDDAIKGPIITAARAKILLLRAIPGPPRPMSPGPCCYARRPIYIR